MAWHKSLKFNLYLCAGIYSLCTVFFLYSGIVVFTYEVEHSHFLYLCISTVIFFLVYLVRAILFSMILWKDKEMTVESVKLVRNTQWEACATIFVQFTILSLNGYDIYQRDWAFIFFEAVATASIWYNASDALK